MSQLESSRSRLTSFLRLSPRRVHISTNPPYGVGFVLCAHVSQADADVDTGHQFFQQHNGIPNCKAGIWTSVCTHVDTDVELGPDTEYILYWVEPGSIDLGQSLDEWEKYEEITRNLDAERKVQLQDFGDWRRIESYYSDDGVLSVISSEYLTPEAARKIQAGAGGMDSAETRDYEEFLEMVTLNGVEVGSDSDGYTIGGLSLNQDSVGGPPRVAIAERDGQVIAIRLYADDQDDDDDRGGAPRDWP